jgi:hypothetical protein
MPHNTYRELSLESLNELLANLVRDMLLADDSNEDNMLAIKSRKKQVEVIIDVIEEKKKV